FGQRRFASVDVGRNTDITQLRDREFAMSDANIVVIVHTYTGVLILFVMVKELFRGFPVSPWRMGMDKTKSPDGSRQGREKFSAGNVVRLHQKDSRPRCAQG